MSILKLNCVRLILLPILTLSFTIGLFCLTYFNLPTPSFHYQIISSSLPPTSTSFTIQAIPQTQDFVDNEDDFLKPISATSFADLKQKVAQIESSTRFVPGTYQFWIYIIISVCLTLFAGLMSGLTVGYLSIDELVMELKMQTGTAQEKKDAQRVLPILHKHHHLLVTLLLCNAAAMEALPIFLDSLVPSYLAIIISVTAVLFFGEIIPQAVCTGPNQIKIAACISPFTLGLMYISFPVSYPISLLLDALLGKHSKSRFLNTDLKALIELHSMTSLKNLYDKDESYLKNGAMGLGYSQTEMIKGAIDLPHFNAGEKMIPFEDVYTISLESELTEERFKKLRLVGHSRIPVYRGHNKHDIVGILLMKKLIGVSAKKGVRVRDLDLKLKKPLVVDTSETLEHLMLDFRSGKSHMAIIAENKQLMQENIDQLFEKLAGRTLKEVEEVLDDSEKKLMFTERRENFATTAKGVITLEDVLEGVLRQNIMDEADLERESKQLYRSQISFSQADMPKKERRMSKSFINEYSSELSTLFDKSMGRTNQILGRTPLGAIQRPAKPESRDNSRLDNSKDMMPGSGSTHAVYIPSSSPNPISRNDLSEPLLHHYSRE